MKRLLFLFFTYLLLFQRLLLPAQERVDTSVFHHLTFETPVNNKCWKIFPVQHKVQQDTIIKKAGKSSWKITRQSDELLFMTMKVKKTFFCDTAELRGLYRCEARDKPVNSGIFLEDGYGNFDIFMLDSTVQKGEWAEFRIKLHCRSGVADLSIGISISCPITLWVDDFELWVDHQSAVSHFNPNYAVRSDHEFDYGSGIVLDTLTKQQIHFLGLTASVWGFLKYHHPFIAAGQINWDYELFRILPQILHCRNQSQCNKVLSGWLRKLGPFPSIAGEYPFSSDYAQLPPEHSWINKKILGKQLAAALSEIRYAKKGRYNYYVTIPRVTDGSAPTYEGEDNYPSIPWNDVGYRLLSLFRFWNAMEYNFPYRDMTDVDWGQVLIELIPRMASIKSEEEYQKTLMYMVAQICDSHGNLIHASRYVTRPFLYCKHFGQIEYIQKQAVIIEPYCFNLKAGDIILAIDGVKSEDYIKQRIPFYPGSNSNYIKQHICRCMSCIEKDSIRLCLLRDSFQLDITLYKKDSYGTFQKFRDYKDELAEINTVYSKHDSLVQSLPEKLAIIRKADAIIVDARSFQPDQLWFDLPSYLQKQSTTYSLYALRDPLFPGGYLWMDSLTIGDEANQQYVGQIVILVDFSTISQGETVAMSLRKMPGAIIVGCTTAGADGEVSYLPLPGDYKAMYTGNGIWNADRSPCQRIGIIPDIYVEKTIEAVSQGRDEILEAAIEFIKKNKVKYGK